MQNNPKRSEFSKFAKSGIWVLWAKKYQLHHLSTKFCQYHIAKVLILNLTLVFQNLTQILKFGHFRLKSINFLIFKKFYMYTIFKYFKSDNGFWEIWKTKTSGKFQISPILKFWVISGCFAICLYRFGWLRIVSAGFGLFWLVSGRFGSFRVLISMLYEVIMVDKAITL